MNFNTCLSKQPPGAAGCGAVWNSSGSFSGGDVVHPGG